MARVITEKYLERKFNSWCKDRDIIPIKGPVQNSKGFPDRFAQLPHGGGAIFVEFKGTSYYSLSPMQVWWKKYLLNSNPNRYFVVETEEELDDLFRMMEKFISIGAKLVDYENKLLNNKNECGIINKEEDVI